MFPPYTVAWGLSAGTAVLMVRMGWTERTGCTQEAACMAAAEGGGCDQLAGGGGGVACHSSLPPSLPRHHIRHKTFLNEGHGIS